MTVIQRLDDFVSRYFVCAKCSACRKFFVSRSVVLSSLLLFRQLSRPMYLLIAVPSAIPSFRLLLGCPHSQQSDGNFFHEVYIHLL